MKMQKYYKQINFWRFLTICAIITVVGVIAYFVCSAYSDGGSIPKPIGGAAIGLVYLIFYPVLLAWLIPSLDNGGIIAGALLGIILDSLLIEFIIIRYKKHKAKKATQSY